MPNWKKVLVSGSNAELNNVTASYFKGDGSALTNLPAPPIETYNTSGDNRIITSVNSNTVQGEEKLLFDGSLLQSRRDDTNAFQYTTGGGYNSNASSLLLEQSGSGDVGMVFAINEDGGADVHWRTYVDNSDSEKYKIGRMSTGGTTGRLEVLQIDSDGDTILSGSSFTLQSEDVGSDTSITIRNSDEGSNTNNTATLKFGHSTFFGGSIVSDKKTSHVNAGNSDSDLVFNVADGNTAVESLRLSTNTSASFSGNLFTKSIFSDSYFLTLENTVGNTNADAGIRVNGNSSSVTGSLLWDWDSHYWKAGNKGSEEQIVTVDATQTLTSKTLTAPIISSISNTGTLTLPTDTDTLVGRTTTDTLENKSISGGDNTLTNIPNSALTNDGITIAGVDTSLGDTITNTTILLSSNVISGSSIASSAQGQVALTTNTTTATAVDLGLQTSDSPTFAGLTIDGDISASGDIIAENYIVKSTTTEVTTSFSTGNTIFGDTIDDTHQFTGSILIGSGSISGSYLSTGSFGRVIGAGSASFQHLSGDGSGITNLPSPPIQFIEDIGNNRILRFNTTSNNNTVKGDGDLTFDGSELLVNGNVSGSTIRAARALYVAGYAGGAGTIIDFASIGTSNWFIGQEPNFTPVTATQQNLIIGQGPVLMTASDNVAVVMRNGGGGGTPRAMRGGYNTIMGSRTAQAARGKLSHSVIIGASAAHQIISSSYNTIIGQGAAFLFDGGASTVLGDGSFPYYSGDNVVPNGEDSTYFQDRSTHNVFIGHMAATWFDKTRTHTTLDHTSNVSNAFRSGSYNTFVGDYTKPGAGFTQFETVLGTGVIGHGSYTSTIGSGSLYVSSQGDGDVYAGMFTGSSVNVDGNITGSHISASGNLIGTIATTEQNSITSATSLGSIGTITTGVWNGTAIASQYLDSDTAHLTTDQTFSGNKTFSAPITASAGISGSLDTTGSFGALNVGNNVLHANIHTNKVGIFTTNPQQTLHVQGSGRFTSDLRLGQQSMQDAALFFEEIGGTSEYYKLHSQNGNLHISQSNLDDSDKDRSIVLKSIADDGNSKLNLTLMHGDVSGSLTSTGSFGRLEIAKTGSFGRINSSTIDIDSIQGNWTNTGNTVADLGSITTVDINGGTIDGITSLTAGGNLDIGDHDLRASTFTADSLTSGRVPFASTNGLLIDDSDFTFDTDTLTVTKLGAFQAAGAINFDSQDMTNVDIDSGTIDGVTIATSDITVGSGKELDVSAGTLTLANDQISGDKVEGGTIAATTITSLSSTSVSSTHVTASGNISGSLTSTGSFGNLLIRDNALISGSLVVDGTISAQEFHTEFVSASIIYKEGSSQFGNSLDDIHRYTGSLQITGSISGSIETSASFGNVVASGNVEALGTGSFRVLEVVETVESQGRITAPGFTSTDVNFFNNDVNLGNALTHDVNLKGHLTGSAGAHISASLTSTGSFGRTEATSTKAISGSFTHLNVSAGEGQNGIIEFYADEGDENSDKWRLFANPTTNLFGIQSYNDGNWQSSFFVNQILEKVQFNENIELSANRNVSGSSTSTGSFGSLVVVDKVQGDLDITGSLVVSGNITGSNFSGSLTSTGSFGFMTIADNTLVTNLNADLLDGNHGSHYTDFTNMTVEAGEVTNTMLANDSVSFGGVSVDLGNSDTTPAFNLQDATAYPGDSSLVTTGTVTTGVWNSTFGTTAGGYISGSVTALSSSLSASIADLEVDSGSFSTRITQATTSIQHATASIATLVSNNTVDVTLAGSYDYLTLSNQTITLNQIDLASDVTGDLPLSNTALVAGTNITLDTNTLNVDDAFLKNDADDSTTGVITAGGFNTTGHVTASLGISGSLTSTGSFARIEVTENIIPKVHNVSELGSSTNRWANIYSADLQLSNEDNEVGNEVDGTKGSWTIQEGKDDLYLLNRKNGKKYRFKLEEIT